MCSVDVQPISLSQQSEVDINIGLIFADGEFEGQRGEMTSSWSLSQ